MRRSHVVCATLLALNIVLIQHATAADKIKNRDWQTGKVLDSQRNRYFAGTVGDANTTIPNEATGLPTSTYSSQTAVYRTYETFLIEGDKYAYVAQERLHWKWSKPANLTVNGPVKYAVEKQTLFVVDEDGKEHEMEIVKKTLREEPAK